mmetsp:Transcript_26133/g.44542  ORF Transcript_26133/g.44542 Transcript_26133/m.44542 type:complete len:99 (+) Transcript_26133:1230-1526(+)
MNFVVKCKIAQIERQLKPNVGGVRIVRCGHHMRSLGNLFAYFFIHWNAFACGGLARYRFENAGERRRFVQEGGCKEAEEEDGGSGQSQVPTKSRANDG